MKVRCRLTKYHSNLPELKQMTIDYSLYTVVNNTMRIVIDLWVNGGDLS